MSIYKLQGETLKQYKLRLIENKIDLGLTWDDIAALINSESGENKNERSYRAWFPAYKEGFHDGTKSVSSISDCNDYDEKRAKFEKARMQLSDYRTECSRQLRESARSDLLAETIAQEISKLQPYEQLKPCEKAKLCREFDSDNDLFVSLNDIHFGADINNHWNIYNPEVAKQRIDKYLVNIIDISKRHNAKNCFVCANGDLISGNIHKTIQISNRENVVRQIMGVSELISWFLSELSKIFKDGNVTFSCVAGNHSRLSKKKESPKDERLDDLIPFYAKARLQNFSNIKFIDNDIDNTFNIINIKGMNYLNVHGDFDNIGNIAKLLDMIDEKIYCIHLGHLHHNSTNSYQAYKIVMSGSLQGVDDFCVEHRIYGKAEQMVCVCSEDGILCQYPVIVQ